METTVKPPVSILLVEDEEVTLKLLTVILAKRFPALALYPAMNGKTGLGLFKEHPTDIVITDIIMPEMSGVQMAEKIRCIKPEVKIIVLTADAGTSDPEEVGEQGLGIDHYIYKPINFVVLFSAIDDCLARIAQYREQHSTMSSLTGLLDALDGDREALDGLIGDFLGSYQNHLQRISSAICAGDARHLEKSAHQFKGSLGIFCRSEPLALTERLLEMGERDTLTQAPRTLELLEQEMERLATSLREFAGR